MIDVREARADDFAKIHPLLQSFNNPHVREEQWRQLFVDHSGLQKGVYGYVLTDDDEIVGFLATTFGERMIRGKKQRICNMSNWVVKEAYRGQSVRLLSKVLELDGVTFSALSPSPQVLKVFKLLRFNMLDKSERIIVPLTFLGLRRRVDVITDPAAIERSLHGDLRTIHRHHRLPYNRHALIQAPEGSCYVLMNRSYKTVMGKVRLPFGRVHHISAPEIFVRYADRLALSAMLHFRVAAVIVDERALRGGKVWHSFARPGTAGTAAFQSAELGEADIDGLYSEAVLLNY
jgi:hypothetical protein